MSHKKVGDLFARVAYVFEQFKKEDKTPANWNSFLKEIGLAHISMARLNIVDKKKFFLAKIKYGI